MRNAEIVPSVEARGIRNHKMWEERVFRHIPSFPHLASPQKLELHFRESFQLYLDP